MLTDAFKRRFTELQSKADKFPLQEAGEHYGARYVQADYVSWGAEAQSLIQAVFGEQSPYYRSFVTALGHCNGHPPLVDTLRRVFTSAREAFEGGYVFNVELQVSGELFGDFVGMAKHALTEGHKDVAAVLACAALEDTLKRFAKMNELSVEDKSMQDIVNALKSKGLVSGAQKSLLDPMPKIRDYAMHARWDKITAPDVNSVIGYVDQFLLSHFSGA